MQFTGILDSTRKEIYEDDIVKIKNSWINQNHVGTVKYGAHTLYNEGGYKQVMSMGFYVRGNIDGEFISPSFELDMFCEMEVIGNIHENPELLEQTK